MNKINVTSEIRPLKKVLLHRPGNELLNLTPDTLQELLFDDIPYLPVAQKEHDEFARMLKENGVEVVYLEDLMADVISLSDEIREEFINQFIYEAGIRTPKYRELVFQYLSSFKNSKELVLKTMEGIQIYEINRSKRKDEKSLVDLVTEETDFLAAPMPNLYFTRDNFASIGRGISLNHMYSVTRNRETIYAEYIFKYHPEYKGQVDKYYDRDLTYHIEGGDILNLNDHILAVGISQRTCPEAIDQLAKNLFKDKKCKIDTVLAFNIPNSRAFMHLDTVFTQIDRNKFTYHPGIMDTLQVFEITEGNIEDSDEDLNVIEINDTLENILSSYLKIPVELIPCAGGDKVAAEREQWNDGSNTLCIAPGVVIVYDRNATTNQTLREKGLKVLEMPGAELSRGRGGPRCMSMPLVRED
ncbi:MAG TPA: arginine deiminase [Candidatus Fimihabitans intestinipullorum]|uniref:Arginine deiminase n=1 Tax=Candidatus Fimihabitans intestinipullorum TaxID=2840820 RepID=A0A9D1HTN1_9BACT|nr:arginine deiminase [Candidatus Fimihabitans intestinipullorum]